MFRLVVLASLLILACGNRLGPIPNNEDFRVVGGEEIDISEVPWQVAIQRQYSLEGDFYLACSGAIIGNNYILTTGSCIYDTPSNRLRVRAGSNSHNKDGTTYLLSGIATHPSFSIETRDYDVAVLTTRLFIASSNQVSSAVLPAPELNIPTGAIGISTGWGSFEASNPTLSDHLREVEVPVLYQDACASIFTEDRMTSRMFCAGGDSGQGACRGDQGNPLIVRGVLVGLLSKTGLCGVSGQPAIYTSVPSVVEWVNSQIDRS